MEAVPSVASPSTHLTKNSRLDSTGLCCVLSYMGTNLPLASFFFLNLISVMLFGMNFCRTSGILQRQQSPSSAQT